MIDGIILIGGTVCMFIIGYFVVSYYVDKK